MCDNEAAVRKISLAFSLIEINNKPQGPDVWSGNISKTCLCIMYEVSFVSQGDATIFFKIRPTDLTYSLFLSNKFFTKVMSSTVNNITSTYIQTDCNRKS
jgi:hypothetical protein